MQEDDSDTQWSNAYDKQLEFKHKLYEQESSFLNSQKLEKKAVKKTVQNCPDCIIGSSPAKYADFKSGQVYLLDGPGVDELNLNNLHFDIPVEYNAAVKKWIRYFTKNGKSWFIRAAERAGRYSPVLSDILSGQKLPRDLIYLSMAESGFQNQARSWAAAMGPWQFIKGTGKKYGLHMDWYVDERKDPLKASLAASKYLRDLFERFDSWPLAMASYNAGEGKISRAIKRYSTKDFWKIRRGSYLARETKDYVPKIMALAIIGKNLSSFGFQDLISFQNKLNYDVLHVKKNTDLYKVSHALEMDFKELKKWNPELLRWDTPSWRDNYPLRIPIGKKESFDDCCADMDLSASDYKRVTFNSSRSLKSLSKEYRVPVQILADLNGLDKNARFKANSDVYLPFKSDHSRWDKLYKDLYLKKKRRRRKGQVSMRRQIARAIQKGTKISHPKAFYKVRKGDNLWTIASKNGVSIHTLIKSNLSKLKNGRIFPGQKLIIR